MGSQNQKIQIYLSWEGENLNKDKELMKERWGLWVCLAAPSPSIVDQQTERQMSRINDLIRRYLTASKVQVFSSIFNHTLLMELDYRKVHSILI